MTNLLNRNVRLFNAVNEFGGMSKISIFEKTDDFEANSIITMSNLTHGLSAFANESDDRFGDYFDGSFEIDQPDDMLHPAKINPAFYPIIITHTLTLLLGISGNLLVIYTWLVHNKFRSPTTIFLVSLAIADLFLLVVLVPLETLEYFMVTWANLSSICKAIAYVEAMSATSTVLNLVAVSIERFLVIVYPMRARSWCTEDSAIKGLVIIWGLSLLLSTPVVLTKHASQITYYNSTHNLTLYYCFDVESSITFYVAVYQLLVMFVLPACFMVACYFVVIRQLWISTHMINAMTRPGILRSSHSLSSMGNSSSLARRDIELSTEQALISTSTGDNSPGNSQCCFRCCNPVHLYQQHRKKRLNGGTDSFPMSQKNDNGRKHNGTVPPVERVRNNENESERRVSKESSNTNPTEASGVHCRPVDCLRQLSCFCCCLSLCRGGHDQRAMGFSEASECTMSTSYIDSMRCATAQEMCISERTSPVDCEQSNTVYYMGNTALEGDISRSGDIHSTVQPSYSRRLDNNAIEITKSRIQVIKMIVLICVLFNVCWAPRLIMNILVKMGLSTYSIWIYNARILCNLLSFVHSALNPFVYLMSSNFRSQVCASCSRRGGRSGSAAAVQQAIQSRYQSQVPVGRQSATNISDELPRNTSQLSRY